jgi:ADP-heptose:LPS heptosyltransferase
MLVLRALGLGDFLTAVPALRALRRARPEHRLALAAPMALAPLAELSEAVHAIHPTPGLDGFRARERPVDIAVNLHGKGPESHRALSSVASREFLAFACPELGFAGPVWRAAEHEVDRWCRLVSEGWGVDADATDLGLRRPACSSVAPGAVVVHPGAAYPARQWPADRFAQVARSLHQRGFRVVITGSQAEQQLARRVGALAGLSRDAVLAGRTDLLGLAALVAEARLVVCGDTGVAHLASAYAVPSVVLFGPTPPSRWGPPETGRHVALWRGTVPGDPWAAEPDPALLRIDPEDVLGQADALLGGEYEDAADVAGGGLRRLTGDV